MFSCFLTCLIICNWMTGVLSGLMLGIFLLLFLSFMGFPDSSVGRESTCNAGDQSSIPGLGRSAGEGIGYPLQYSWASLVAQLVKNPPAMQETRFNSWVGKICWRKGRLPTPVFLGFPCGSAGEESAYNVGDLGFIPGLGRSPGEGNGYLLQYSGIPWTGSSSSCSTWAQ